MKQMKYEKERREGKNRNLKLLKTKFYYENLGK